MQDNSVTLSISTYRRPDIWLRGLLLHSLYMQTDTNYELLIIDDYSKDNTIKILKECFKNYPPPFKVKLFKTLVKKQLKTQSSALPDNIGFKEATGDILIHLDDDCWINKELIAYTKSLMAKREAVYYGQTIYMHDNGISEICRDRRNSIIKQCGTGINNVLLEKPEDVWGALWIAPLKYIHQIGGYNISLLHYRGADARMGYRLFHSYPCYFNIHPAMHCYHLGYSWLNQKTRQNISMKEIQKVRKIPTEDFKPEIIVNGGLAFWDSDWFKGKYRKVKL